MYLLEDGPLIVLLEKDSADEPCDGGFVGKDTDDVGATLDLGMEPFDRVCGSAISGRCSLGKWNGRLPPPMLADGRVELDPRGPTASKCQVGRASSSQANRRVQDED